MLSEHFYWEIQRSFMGNCQIYQFFREVLLQINFGPGAIRIRNDFSGSVCGSESCYESTTLHEGTNAWAGFIAHLIIMMIQDQILLLLLWSENCRDWLSFLSLGILGEYGKFLLRILHMRLNTCAYPRNTFKYFPWIWTRLCKTNNPKFVVFSEDVAQILSLCSFCQY